MARGVRWVGGVGGGGGVGKRGVTSATATGATAGSGGSPRRANREAQKAANSRFRLFSAANLRREQPNRPRSARRRQKHRLAVPKRLSEQRSEHALERRIRTARTYHDSVISSAFPRSRAITEDHGRSRKVTEYHGSLTGGHGKVTVRSKLSQKLTVSRAALARAPCARARAPARALFRLGHACVGAFDGGRSLSMCRIAVSPRRAT